MEASFVMHQESLGRFWRSLNRWLSFGLVKPCLSREAAFAAQIWSEGQKYETRSSVTVITLGYSNWSCATKVVRRPLTGACPVSYA